MPINIFYIMDTVSKELAIPKKYIKLTNRPDRLRAIVHKLWLKSLLQHGILVDFIECEHFETWPQNNEGLGKSWCQIYINIYKKRNVKVIPLPRAYTTTNSITDPELTFSQLLHYVMQTNHKNLWKEAYKKHISTSAENKDLHINLTDYNIILREIIIRTYGCSIINLQDPNMTTTYSKHYECHSNLLQTLCCIENENFFFTFHSPFVGYTLQDCLTFSPAILETNYTKSLFIIFQLLQVLKSMHDRGLTVGDITLSDIYLDDNLWVQIMPQLESNLIIRNEIDDMTHSSSRLSRINKLRSIPECGKNIHSYENARCIHCSVRCYDKLQINDGTSLEQLCELWIHGQISNFTYLTALNNLSGRRYGEPNCHHVFPWVTDFTSRCGNNWRDLTKSKFRLNKGDRQLDLTYESNMPPTQVPHHVSDVLSSITYYVYMARRTPKSVLCKNVRTIWVPAEYPSSIQRLQEWTPDECIPEFFNKPSVFKSIHEDLADLEVPPWSSSPEDFIEKHREALESAFVSERLHHWIDLNFGYKLSGLPAIKSKNVVLQLVDNHQELSNSGVVQLFHFPHPARQTSLSPWISRLPPKIYFVSGKQKRRDTSVETQRQNEDMLEETPNVEEDFASSQNQSKSSLGLSRLLSRSRTSLTEETAKTDTVAPPTTTKTSPSSSQQKISPKTQKVPTFLSHIQPSSNQLVLDTDKKTTFQSYISNPQKINPIGITMTALKSNYPYNVIHLPKDYNPYAHLNAVEVAFNFLTKTFHQQTSKSYFKSETNPKSIDDLENAVSLNKFDCVRLSKSSSPYEMYDDQQLNNAFTNRIFAENYEAKLAQNFSKTMSKSLEENSIHKNVFNFDVESKGQNHKQAVATRRIRELQVLGCLIVEIFMSKELRALGLAVQLDFISRLKACLIVIKSSPEILPLCIKYPAQLLLQTDLLGEDYFEQFRYPTVTTIGLPPPSAHQLLQPLLSASVFPFSINFWSIYTFLNNLNAINYLSNELEINTYFNCMGDNCIKYEQQEKNKIATIQKISECKVKICAKELESCLSENAVNVLEIIELILSYIIDLLNDPNTCILAAWYLFDPIAKALGPHQTQEKLLKPILKLYEGDGDHLIIHKNKIVKIYHHSFLLRLIVRFGMKQFLDNFTTVLVEAVGGYRDSDNPEIPLHSHINRPLLIRKTSNLKYVEDQDHSDILSPLDDDSIADLETYSSHTKASLLEKQAMQDDKSEPEMFAFDNEDKIASPNESSNQIYDIMDHLDLNLGSSTNEETEQIINEQEQKSSTMSPTIPIPSSYRRSELVSIDCEVGSKKSQAEFEGAECDLSNKAEDDAQFEILNDEFIPIPTKEENAKISDVSADSLIWLSHRLGPVLTAKYLSRNLLRMLTLCYVGKENLLLLPASDHPNKATKINERIVGDQNAVRVLNCLTSIAALYGEHLILFQYLPHISELIVLCKRRITPNLEGGLISCVALLRDILPCLSNQSIHDHMQDEILKPIIIPCIRLVGTTRTTFPSGATARLALAKKIIDTLYVAMRRMVCNGKSSDIFISALQRFFFIFSKSHDKYNEENFATMDVKKNNSDSEGSCTKSMEESNYLEVRRDGTTAEWAVRDGRALRVGCRVSSSESWSPPIPLTVENQSDDKAEESIQSKACKELKEVFTCELAHETYIPLAQFLGDTFMKTSLKNDNLIRDLCHQFEQEMQLTYPHINKASKPYLSDLKTVVNEPIVGSTGSFGSNVSLIGNRIDIVDTNEKLLDSEAACFINNKMENTTRHLRGNWLAYWEHEIGRADKDNKFNFKQIKLQTFQGHINSIRGFYIFDNENSFMSGSRDKTIKLWSLRSQGNGTAVSQPQWTYTGHKKSVLGITFVESLRLAVSCDSTVHIWDPFMGAVLSQLETSPKNPPVNVLKAIPPPSSSLLVATTEGTIRSIDARLCNYTHEYKVSTTLGGVIRCLAISPCSNLLAVGHSTGNVVLLDLRVGGRLISTWKAHDGELLQLAVPDSQSLITSSLDQAVTVWNLNDGKLKCHLKGATEPVHCLCYSNNELISGTTANRIGIYSTIDSKPNYSSTRLRSDTFKGVLTSMAVLPLNKLLVLGADNGNITLLC